MIFYLISELKLGFTSETEMLHINCHLYGPSLSRFFDAELNSKNIRIKNTVTKWSV